MTMLQQQSLFDLNQNAPETCFHTNIEKSGFTYEELNIGDITFKSGQSESIHRWYRLTPSYSPNLVRYLIKEFEINKNHFVFDPFSGRGTTTIECQKEGIKALATEINPLLQEVGDKSLYWGASNLNLFDSFLKEADKLIQKYANDSIEETIEKINTTIPIIHNVFRWWKPEVLKNLLIFRKLVFKEKYKPVFNYLWLAVNKAGLDCANIHRGHPTITFDDNHKRNIDVYSEISANLKAIAEDVKSLTSNQLQNSELNSIVVGNSTADLTGIIKAPVDFVITSPPYPNRYSYVHQTRPQLHFMELLENIREATEIDLNAIGGTWGRATSILQKELLEVPDEIKGFLDYHSTLKERSILMCNYATKYFIDMWKHIKALKEVINSNFQGAYVVGNSRLSDVEIFTEVILGNIFEAEGFKVDKILSFRKRGGRQRLYETAVCVKK